MLTIGLAGGIGAGKTTIARYFGELGCCLVSSDELNRAVLEERAIIAEITRQLGREVLDERGRIDREKLAQVVFTDPRRRERLENITHPRIAQRRDQMIAEAINTPGVPAVILDSPLLFESGLDRECDVCIFVDAPPEERLARVQRARKWDAEELTRREKLQWTLDRKQNLCEHTITNTGAADRIRAQVRALLSQIIQSKARRGT